MRSQPSKALSFVAASWAAARHGPSIRRSTARRLCATAASAPIDVVTAPAGFPCGPLAPPPGWVGDRSVRNWAADFVRRYWQQRPLLIRQAFDGRALEDGLLTPDELAGLACDDDVESRVISHKAGATPEWQLKTGPFSEDDFTTLPARDYTLLVHEVNRHVPIIQRLLDRFFFVPHWRVDDIMVSYAAPGGGVGPHFDNYDVFLLQARGTRRWRVSREPVPVDADEDALLVPDLPVRVLAPPWRGTDEWVLEPGDMLYLPPRVPHWGVAEDDDGCMTYSVGFRAPTVAEMVTRVADSVSDEDGNVAAYFKDDVGDLARVLEAEGAHGAGVISTAAMARAKEMVHEALFGEGKFEAWFASAVAEPKRFRQDLEVVDSPEFDEEMLHLMDHIAKGPDTAAMPENAALCRLGGTTFCYRDDDTAKLIVDGTVYPLAGSDRNDAEEAVRLLSGPRSRIPLGSSDPEGRANVGILARALRNAAPLRNVMLELFQTGALYFTDATDEEAGDAAMDS